MCKTIDELIREVQELALEQEAISKQIDKILNNLQVPDFSKAKGADDGAK